MLVLNLKKLTKLILARKSSDLNCFNNEIVINEFQHLCLIFLSNVRPIKPGVLHLFFIRTIIKTWGSFLLKI